MAKQSAKTYKLQIKELKILSFNVVDEPADFKPGTEITFNINVGHAIDTPNKNVIVVVTVELFDVQKPIEILSRMQVMAVYHFPEFDSFVTSDTKDIPDDLRLLIHSITISTTRGMLYTSLRGSYLERAILPIVNPQAMEYKTTE